MKRSCILLLGCVVFFCLVQAGAALTYEKMDVDRPVDALRPGDAVTVTGILKLPPSGDQTFDMEDIVELYTQLDSVKWQPSIVVNGQPNPQPEGGGKRVTINGMDLAYYATKYEVKVSFTMSGSVPTTYSSGTIILLRALELDEDSEQVGAAVYKNGTVFNPTDLQAQVTKKEAELRDLRRSIDDEAAKGIDVSAAEKNYTAAKSAIDDAGKKITTSPGDVTRLLSTASVRIESAKVDLKRAWADQSLREAKAMLASVDGLIREFTVNRSLKTTDPRLGPIITKRDLGARSISDASDLFTSGSYDSARVKADDGYGLADEAWNLSLSLKEELDKGFALPDLSAFFPVLIVAAVILVIAGVIIYRKKTHWDELG